MLFLKKAFLGSIAAAAMAVSTLGVAAPINYVIQLEAFVPTSSFYVLPTDTSWIGNPQKLNYNPTTTDLSQLTKQFDVLHTAGSISAQLLAPAILGSAGDNIFLTVKFNRVEVTTAAAEVVSEAQAGTPSVANLEIIPVKPTGGYMPGNYAGNVQLSFDAVII